MDVRPSAPSRAPAALAALLALLTFSLAGQGMRSLWDPDEGRYTVVALEMLASGDWMTPRLHPEIPHFTKPPLTYWLLASSIGVLGRGEWAVRLPGALAFAAATLLIFGMGRLLNPRSPTLAPLIFATSLFPFVASNLVTTDIFLLLWEALAIFAFLRFWWGKDPRRRFIVLMWAAFGLGFLTKGPPALMPLAGILPFLFLNRQGPPRRWFLSPTGLALFAALAFGWYGFQIYLRPDLLDYLLGKEVVGRVATSIHHRNPGWEGLLKAYGPVLVLGMMPWAPLGLVAWWRQRGSAAEHPEPRRVWWLLGLVILVPLAIFVIIPSRQPLYLLPLTVPSALAIDLAIAGRFRWTRRRRALLATWVVFLLGLRIASGFVPSRRDPRPLVTAIRENCAASPREVIFVNRRPLYTLAFYLGSEIERVSLDPLEESEAEPSYRPLVEPIEEELAEGEAGTIYLVPERDEEHFLADVQAAGWHSTPCGRFSGMIFYGSPVPASGQR